MTGFKLNLKKIILFASGSGSNAEKICKYFEKKKNVSLELLVCNNPNAKVLKKTNKYFINSMIIDYESFYNSSAVLEKILNINPSLIVLAGFLWKIPEKLIKAFPEKIINIHPALLPKFGGKGMYGINIHNAVIEKKETKSGITIHYVNKNYDEGEVIFQKTIDIKKNETPEELSSRILKLEHNFFPRIINQVLESGK
ncbi:MAG: phosphoribosylglycinamide formyltransferase [Flavobacteriaceae bacterium]|nr:phosphoribosylglycinamide formyltransferase [Flavobacteriaceae bacterium]RCL66922.1 MAG: phosphoribosylglycinamide formyltransferase [Cryomorphaceae bacterium]